LTWTAAKTAADGGQVMDDIKRTVDDKVDDAQDAWDRNTGNSPTDKAGRAADDVGDAIHDAGDDLGDKVDDVRREGAYQQGRADEQTGRL